MKGFTTRDLSFAGVSAALIIVLNATTIILFHMLFARIPGIRSLASSFLSMIVLALALSKIEKTGAATLIQTVTGLFYAFVMPAVILLLPLSIFAGICSDAVALLSGKGYRSPVVVTLACGMNRLGSTAFSLLLLPLFVPVRRFMSPAVIAGVCGGCFVLAVLGGLVGVKLAKELRKAGVLR